MNKDAIKRTAVCRLERDDGLYVVESPLLEICSGVDEDPRHAKEIFEDLLDAMYTKYLEGKVVGQYERRGRPAKGGVVLSCSVRPNTKTAVENLAKEIDISQGEVVDYLLAFYLAARSMQAPSMEAPFMPAPAPVHQAVAALKSAITSTTPRRKTVKE